MRGAGRRLLPGLLLLSAAAVAWTLLSAGASRKEPSPGEGGGGAAPGAATGEATGGSGRRPPGPLAGTDVPHLSRKAMPLIPGVYLLGETYPNAAYVVETADGLVLVDTCKEEDGVPILDQLRALRLDPMRIRKILLTHSHGDHSMGAARLAEVSGAEVYAGRKDAEVLRAGGPVEAIYSIFGMTRAPHRTRVDVDLDGGEEIRLGEALFRALAAPGHTPGSVCFLLELRGLRILFTGDVVMSLTDEGPLTGTGVYSTMLAPRFGGDADAFEATLRMLGALPAPDLVLPGHPGADLDPQDPRVPEWWWKELIAGGLSRIQRIRSRLGTDGADFLDGSPRELLPGVYAVGLYGGTACYALRRNGAAPVLLNFPGDGGSLDLLRENLRKAGAGAELPSVILLTSSWVDASGGLRELLEDSPCTVYAPAGGMEEIRGRCPEGADIRPAESLPGDSGIDVSVLPVEGAASPAVSYLFLREGKRLLATGELPDPVTVEPESQTGRWSGRKPRDSAAALASLVPHAEVQPDLWLPLRPIMDQNANLYDSDWERILAHTRFHLQAEKR